MVERSERAAPTPADWLVFALLLLGALLMCGPFVWMISTSLKPMAEVFRFPPQLLSATPQPANYQRIFSTIPFGRAITNSLIVAAGVTLLQLVVCSMAAYAFAFGNPAPTNTSNDVTATTSTDQIDQSDVDEQNAANDVADALNDVQDEANNTDADDQSGDQQGPDDNSEEDGDSGQSGESGQNG